MIKLCSLYSGSSGNCIFIGTSSTKILIDVGVSAVRVERALKAIGEHPDEIDAIFVTHEHTDHIKGVGVFARRYGTRVYANENTWNAMSGSRDIGVIDDKCIAVSCCQGGTDISVGDIDIHSFCIPHDAADPTAYTFYIKDRKLTVATDIGYISDEVRCNLRGSDVVLLESNHDINMLQSGAYPPALKRRILSDHGHLCNDDAASLVSELAYDGTKCVFLGHLSRENNLPSLAFQASAARLEDNGFEMIECHGGFVPPDIFHAADNYVHLSVAPRDNISEVVEL